MSRRLLHIPAPVDFELRTNSPWPTIESNAVFEIMSEPAEELFPETQPSFSGRPPRPPKITARGLEDWGDAGLADRLLLIRMERRQDETSDSALTDEILSARDAGLSHIAATLQKALADKGSIQPGLNARHPDFATFAVRIGRALGQEAKAIAALKAAEADKSAFCLENDVIATALLAYLRTAEAFRGTAAELARHLGELDAELKDLTAGSLSKRLSAIWPHLQKILALARKQTGHGGALTFTLKAPTGDNGDFQTAFS